MIIIGTTDTKIYGYSPPAIVIDII